MMIDTKDNEEEVEPSETTHLDEDRPSGAV